MKAEKCYDLTKGGTCMFLMSLDFQIVGIVLWVIVFFVAVIIESLEPQLVSIWFAGGAFVALIFATLFRVSLMWEILIFMMTSVILLLLTRPFVKRVTAQKTVATNADALIGQEILVDQGFGPKQSGSGLHSDIRWKLISDETVSFQAGEFAIIKAIKGNKLLIEKKKVGN
jgi:membrane protein implicated in regulation of membrane protease activity